MVSGQWSVVSGWRCLPLPPTMLRRPVMSVSQLPSSYFTSISYLVSIVLALTHCSPFNMNKRFVHRVYTGMFDLVGQHEFVKSVQPIGDSSNHWCVEIKGPENTPYERGVFKVMVTFDENYPDRPPNCKFGTKIWHPNIFDRHGSNLFSALNPKYQGMICMVHQFECYQLQCLQVLIISLLRVNLLMRPRILSRISGIR